MKAYFIIQLLVVFFVFYALGRLIANIFKN